MRAGRESSGAEREPGRERARACVAADARAASILGGRRRALRAASSGPDLGRPVSVHTLLPARILPSRPLLLIIIEITTFCLYERTAF